MPEVGATDGVEDGVHALAREAVNFLHVVLIPVIDGDTAQLGNGRAPRKEATMTPLSSGTAAP